MTLVLATFLLTILGTFMTRSGVFSSVTPSRRRDRPARSWCSLVIAPRLVGGASRLRIDRLAPEGTIEPALGRDSLFLVNNLVFVLFTFTVLLGTVFPLVVEAARGVQMSVGRPYFDRMAVPLGVVLLLLMGVGPALPWGRATAAQVKQALLPPLAGAALFAAVGLALGVRKPWTLVALAFGGYTVQVTLRELWLPIARRRSAHGEGLGQALVETGLRRGRRRFGSYIVHAGAATVIVAIAVSSTMGESREAQLRVGGEDHCRRLHAHLRRRRPERAAPGGGRRTRVGGARGRELGEPALNQYERQREPIGTPAVRSSLFEDLYLSVMNIDPAAGTLGLVAMVNPMVGWIWAATALMALGSLVALVPSRPDPRP